MRGGALEKSRKSRPTVLSGNEADTVRAICVALRNLRPRIPNSRPAWAIC